MSKQQRAPGRLELVREFVNTVDIEQGSETFNTPPELARWLADHRLAAAGTTATPRDLRHAVELREALRAVLLAHNGADVPPLAAAGALDRAAQRGGVSLRFDSRGAATLEAGAPGVDGALGRLLAIIYGSIGDGTWQRLKACRDPRCEWAFYDHTKNRSGTWCSMDGCGNRAKARAYRERHGGATRTG
jgi:predicted RNA-binding Zn ribbon-like protein